MDSEKKEDYNKEDQEVSQGEKPTNNVVVGISTLTMSTKKK